MLFLSIYSTLFRDEPFFSLEIKEVITRPSPIPMSIDATKNRGDTLRKTNPTPIPISVVPPMAHVLLSIFLFALSIIHSFLAAGRRN